MMSDFRGEGGSKMTPKSRTLEGKNRTLGGRGGQKSSKIVGHHLCMFPNPVPPKLCDVIIINKKYPCLEEIGLN